jgi:tetratricopeptide (TPR) repeat protein
MSESRAYDLFRQGRDEMARGRNAEAVTALEEAKELEPAKASIREALGIAYFRLRRFSDAEREFRAVVELDPVDDYAHFALGRCLEKQRRPDEAVGHLRLATSLRPERREYRRALDALRPSA